MSVASNPSIILRPALESFVPDRLRLEIPSDPHSEQAPSGHASPTSSLPRYFTFTPLAGSPELRGTSYLSKVLPASRRSSREDKVPLLLFSHLVNTHALPDGSVLISQSSLGNFEDIKQIGAMKEPEGNSQILRQL